MLPQLTTEPSVCFSGWQMPIVMVFSIWGAVYLVISMFQLICKLMEPLDGGKK